ncbi:uncharacterized protein LOC131669242 [Phymastichus coffea]|uniref:uncharacterized protein LOC131669242 n=1 Tax=Phymastichus coffea TaxID=108790 RepID=UPI00273C160E|nr:uncharacterized protein LOC131669242 [Phymastichus coffea]
MVYFRKLTKKYRFFKKKSIRKTLLQGSFTPLDIVRLSKNSFHANERDAVKYKKSKLTTQEDTTNNTIIETDSKPKDAEFPKEENHVNSDSKTISSTLNQELQRSKTIIKEKTDSNISKLGLTRSSNNESSEKNINIYCINTIHSN